MTQENGVQSLVKAYKAGQVKLYYQKDQNLIYAADDLNASQHNNEEISMQEFRSRAPTCANSKAVAEFLTYYDQTP